ncbi:LAGLIDADG family homing endonuclease [Thermococcus sp. 21S7]|uniref:LAGLIDADG family homing endonuclease n=1 Tax=Thermococcus sp. 21S7 TaxID=1638221 RepID=UPI00143B0E58|nr:LAGLIDADG family homing endonuclease [Thermococcus sp. 21S7]NJE60974.1 DNA endonuclease [Thermococcus sp. 21S7]
MRTLRDLPPSDVERIQERARQLRESGMSYLKIAQELAEEFNVSVSKATVLRWCKGSHNTFNKTKRVNLEPSPELAYIVGAYLGDASLSERNYQYRIRLKVVDREFAQNFERAVRAIGANPRAGFERNRSRANRWWVEVTNKELFMFLKGPKEKLFEVGREYPREFLRGFFDSEGSVYVNTKDPRRAAVVADHYNTEVLKLCKELLGTLGIHSTIYLVKKKGTKVMIRGQEYQYNNDLYRISIHRRTSVARFAEKIGFSISRKQEKLETFLEAFYSHTSERDYHKTKSYSGGRI